MVEELKKEIDLMAQEYYRKQEEEKQKLQEAKEGV